MKNIALLALAGIIATALFAMSSRSSSNMEAQFREFLETYRVGYGTTDEYSFRLGVFEANMKRAEELSILNPEAEFGVTRFSDRTAEEMQKMKGFTFTKNLVSTQETFEPITAGAVDWSKMWNSIKNQGECGACWAFSAAAAFEARYALSKGSQTTKYVHSEQQLID